MSFIHFISPILVLEILLKYIITQCFYHCHHCEDCQICILAVIFRFFGIAIIFLFSLVCTK